MIHTIVSHLDLMFVIFCIVGILETWNHLPVLRSLLPLVFSKGNGSISKHGRLLRIGKWLLSRSPPDNCWGHSFPRIYCIECLTPSQTISKHGPPKLFSFVRSQRNMHVWILFHFRTDCSSLVLPQKGYTVFLHLWNAVVNKCSKLYGYVVAFIACVVTINWQLNFVD